MIDALYIPVVVAVLIIAIAFGYFILNQLSTPLYEATGIQIFNTTQAMTNAMVFMMIAIYFGLPSVGIILSFLSGANPIFLPVGIILLIISPFIFWILKNVMIEIFSSSPIFINLFSNPILGTMLEYFPLLMTVFGALIIFLQFVISRTAE